MTFSDVKTSLKEFSTSSKSDSILPVIFYEFFIIVSFFSFYFLWVLFEEFCLCIFRNWSISIRSYSFVVNGQLNMFFAISEFSLAHQLSTYDILHADIICACNDGRKHLW
ncbi:hypothetical protein WA026_022835 [Henosepilachna vigintioctopunctata]|uniref:Uncharacterized protein n=1 Tax=Henosepilachna vigintioctopunctata TaxID=420089 RepID=A0AAW1UVM7_9CUCU